MERNMQLKDWLDDLCVRFLLNGPKEDLETAERICFRVEEAQWYYEDFIRPLDPSLPSMTLKHFCEAIFAHCPMLLNYSQDHCMSAFDTFLSYKKRVPVRGAIMLNQDMDKVVLVKGWKKSANWGFPRGKINKDEDDLDCAIREVYEETGYDLEDAGFVPENREVKSIELNMHEQQIRLFLFRGIPTDTHFEPRTRKEISTINWWWLSDLPTYRKGKQQAQQQPVYNPTNFYMVAPFLVHVRKWIAEQKKHDLHKQVDSLYITPAGGTSQDEDQGLDSNVEAISRQELSIKKKSSINGTLGRSNPFLGTTQQSSEVQSHSKNLLGNSKGNALLSLLQSKPTDASYPKPHDDLPRTPLDHDTLPAYMPQTPHHQDPKPPHSSSIPLASSYPNYEQSEEESFCYKQSQIKKQYEKMIEAQKHIQAQQQTLNFGAHPYQPQHLIHPQPLPPYVQRAVFAQSPIPDSPMYTKAPSHLNLISMSPQSPPALPIMIPESKKPAPPKLTNHTLALLNSFKSQNNGNVPTTSYDKQIPERTPESHYSYVDMPSAPTPPMKHMMSEPTDKYNNVFTSTWPNVLQQKVVKKDTRHTLRQDFEQVCQEPTTKQDFSDEPITPKITASWQGASTTENGCLESNQVHNLAFYPDQYDSWGSHIKQPHPTSPYNEKDITNPNICAQNLFSAKTLPQPPIQPRVQTSVKLHQVARKPYQNTKTLIFPHQPQELPASSLSKKKTFPSAAFSSNENLGVRSLNPILDSENYLTGKHKFHSLNDLKGFNTKFSENFNPSSVRPPRPKTPSAVELSAVDSSADNTTLFSTLLDNNPMGHSASITNHISESAKLPFGATKILLRPPNQEKMLKPSLGSTDTQSDYLKRSGEKISVCSQQKSTTKDSSAFLSGVMKFHSNQPPSAGPVIMTDLGSSNPPESSKILEYKYRQTCHPQNIHPLVGKEVLSQSHNEAKNTFSSLSNSRTFPTSKTGALVTALPVIRKKSQPISPSDKGFLLSYLEAVVAKEANS